MNIPKNLLPDETSPDWMNKADNAWQLTAATLVGLQGIPGLVLLYTGMIEKRWAVNSASMVLYAFASVLICWVGWAFRMSFGEELTVFWGKPAVALDDKYLTEQAFLGYFPNATMVFFQFVFAAVTLILVAGALLGRMNFKAWMLFVPLWLTFSYTIGAYSMWNPNGWLAKLGVIDFAGGYVVHLASGIAGFTAAFWVGPRAEKDNKSFPPNNILMALAGGGLLWMGWSGFNGGAPYAASTLVSLAVLNTHVCASASMLTWLILDTFTFGKPSVVGAIQGMITGLVCITPGAGVVQCWAAILMGIFSGSIPWYTMSILQHKIKFLRHVDDALGMFHTHAIAGTLGGLLTGFFAVPRLCHLFFAVPDKYIGLAYALHMGQTIRGFRQMGLQLIGMAFIACLNFITTSLICLLIKLIVPLRMSDKELEIGDEEVHGEQASANTHALEGQGGNAFENPRKNSVYDVDEYPSVVTKTFSRDVPMRRI